MTNKKYLHKMMCSAIILGFTCSAYIASAEEAEFTLDPVLVTAMRTESKELTTPAYTHVYNEQQLKQTGASNLLDALQFTEGIIYDGYGASGHYYASMTAKADIRGMDRGTVVLINGVPTNMSGYYALERMPLENIKKVEIVKGASSVLYGTAALGGVINIITKDTVQNSIHVEKGSFGRSSEDLSLQVGKLAFSGVHSEQGDVGPISDPWSSSGKNRKYTAFRGDERNLFRWTWKFNEDISLTHQRDIDDFHFDRLKEKGDILDEVIDQKETKDTVALNIKHGKWKSNVYSNRLIRDYQKPFSSVYTPLNENYTDTQTTFKTLGLDSQTSWKSSWGRWIGGVAWQNEKFESSGYAYTQDDKKNNIRQDQTVSGKDRDFYSFFAQLTHPLANNRDLIVGARQEFVNQQANKNYREFCPQVQLITRIAPDQSWYINAGRAFRMPNMSDLYGETWRKSCNPDLDPEYGYNYEVGWKQVQADHSLKVALYHMDFKNYIQWKKIGDDSYSPFNTDFKNTGLEVSYDKKVNDNLSYTLGGSISNPQEKAQQKTGDGDWELAFAKLQFTGGVHYQKDKWSASLQAAYLGNRKDDRKPTLPVNLTLQYQTSKVSTLNLRVENLFDRDDIVSHGSSEYHATPRAISVGLTSKF